MPKHTSSLLFQIQIHILFFIVFTCGHVRHPRKLGSHLTHEIERNSEHMPFGPINSPDLCPEGSVCVLPVLCPAHVRDEDRILCLTKKRRRGFCCSSGHNHTSKRRKPEGIRTIYSNLRYFSLYER